MFYYYFLYRMAMVEVNGLISGVGNGTKTHCYVLTNANNCVMAIKLRLIERKAIMATITGIASVFGFNFELVMRSASAAAMGDNTVTVKWKPKFDR